jgi:hypothetical protein
MRRMQARPASARSIHSRHATRRSAAQASQGGFRGERGKRRAGFRGGADHGRAFWFRVDSAIVMGVCIAKSHLPHEAAACRLFALRKHELLRQSLAEGARRAQGTSQL